MLNARRRILELALESLELKKKDIDAEIGEIKSELQGKANYKKASRTKAAAKGTRFTKKERLRRSQRMKEYWENWRKKKAKKSSPPRSVSV